MFNFHKAGRGDHPNFDHDAALKLIPNLRRLAFAVTHNADATDDLVEIALRRAIDERAPNPNGIESRIRLFHLMHTVLAEEMRTRARYGSKSRTRKSGSSELEINCEKLPFDQRITLLLVVLEGLSYEEVAEITGVGIGIVRSRLSHARESLRRERTQSTEQPEIKTAAGDDRVERTERLSGWRVAAKPSRTGHRSDHAGPKMAYSVVELPATDRQIP